MISHKKEKILFFLFLILFILLGAFKLQQAQEEDPLLSQSIVEIAEESSLKEVESSGKEEQMSEIKEENQKKDELIYVHIDGEVEKPGLYSACPGDRVLDIIQRAGGLTSEADLTAVNLAIKVVDEMKIIIPNKEFVSSEETNKKSFIQFPSPPKEASSNEKKKEGAVNINMASKEELMTLPFIGSSRADSIIEYREEHLFENIEEIKNISGIGDKAFEKLKDKIAID